MWVGSEDFSISHLTVTQVFPETKGRTLEEVATVFDGEVAETNVHRRISLKMEEIRGTVNSTGQDIVHKERALPKTFA